MKRIIVLSVLIFSLFSTYGQDINGLALREGKLLNGEWKVIVDPYENGYYSYRWQPFDAAKKPSRSAFFMDSKANSPSDLIEYDFNESKSLLVPGDWNTQMRELYYYEGTVWYRKKFDYSPKENTKSFVYFDAVNYKADVYLNGNKLGTHIGGFTPFWFDITEHVKDGSNSLVLKVDNSRHSEGVPTLNTDWWNYGGITRKVRIISTPVDYITDFMVQLISPDDSAIEGYVKLSSVSAGQKLSISFPELNKNIEAVTDNTGKAVFSAKLKKLELWSPEKPILYTLNIESEHDQISDKVGFRTIQTEGKKLLLNGKEIYLRGISIHEELALNGGGRVNSPEKSKQLLQWALELNCNFVRLAHYPHNEDIVRMADEMGILVWSEVPVYWTIDWENKETYQNAENQISEMIQRDKNRASVIIWSIANETPVKPERTEFLSNLASHVRSLDNTRLVSAAMERHGKPGEPSVSVVQDPLADVVDLVSFNQYTGWYGSTPDRCAEVSWEIPYNKPVFVSEFGGGAKLGLHGDKHARWTEEYQEYLYEETIKMLGQIDGLCGFSPWILVDFRSPRRVLPGIQDDFNRKGLISDDGKKKKAFHVLKDFYNTKKE
jgi:beta-glucuronidase